jgi:hypothetical protein
MTVLARWERFPNDLISLQRLSRGRSTPLEYRSSRWGALRTGNQPQDEATVRSQGVASVAFRLLEAARSC